MRIFHVAERSAWEAAKTAGAYARSTRGRTLEEEGFIHAATAAQVPGVVERYWADHPGPLVLLEIDTDRLTAPWRMEQAGSDSFPHIHGPLNPGAVVSARPLPRATSTAGPRTFWQEFLVEFSFRLGLGVFVMVVAAVCGFAAELLIAEDSGLWGLLVGFAVAVAVAVAISRWRRDRLSRRGR